jgi:hypothetical protein
MAGPRASFDLRTAQRVASATKWVEQQPRATESAGYGKPRDLPGLFPVIVKWSAGSDGTYSKSTNTGSFASWTYDLYPQNDTGYTTKLNKAGALQPKRSPARMFIGPVGKAPDGSVGLAYFDSTGAIALWDLQETRATEACS